MTRKDRIESLKKISKEPEPPCSVSWFQPAHCGEKFR